MILEELSMGSNVLATDILFHITVLISFTSNSWLNIIWYVTIHFFQSYVKPLYINDKFHVTSCNIFVAAVRIFKFSFR
jgi:hypothetical protein